MVSARPGHDNYADLLNQIRNGTIKIPQFQRDFVWSKLKSAALLDSIIKGYPVGTFIFWHTDEKLRTVRSIGEDQLRDKPGSQYFDYVLDGQQRLTSLYAAVNGKVVKRESGVSDDFSKMYVNLDASEHDAIVTSDLSALEGSTYISLTELLNAGLDLAEKFDRRYWRMLQRYSTAFTTYSFPIVYVSDAEIDVATEIFTRINVGGKPLTTFEIMVAKTYDEKRKFDLAAKFEELADVLGGVGYDTMSEITPLQLIALIARRECKRETILKLDKKVVIDTWEPAAEAIKQSVDYFKAAHGVAVSRLLPYGALMIPFAYFFYKNNGKKPNHEQARLLTDFFWRCSLGGRYSVSLESRLAQDIGRIDEILKGATPTYDWPVHTEPEFILANGWFTPARAFIKAILCIYASFQPRSFDNNAIVNIANDSLKRANSRNYHHFFPRAYLRKNGVEDRLANNVVNITMIDAHLNKNQIRAHSPSDYMQEYEYSNPDMPQTLKSHLMTQGTWADILQDDYDRFLKRRAGKISGELKKRIIPQDIDKEVQEIEADQSDADLEMDGEAAG